MKRRTLLEMIFASLMALWLGPVVEAAVPSQTNEEYLEELARECQAIMENGLDAQAVEPTRSHAYEYAVASGDVWTMNLTHRTFALGVQADTEAELWGYLRQSEARHVFLSSVRRMRRRIKGGPLFWRVKPIFKQMLAGDGKVQMMLRFRCTWPSANDVPESELAQTGIYKPEGGRVPFIKL